MTGAGVQGNFCVHRDLLTNLGRSGIVHNFFHIEFDWAIKAEILCKFFIPRNKSCKHSVRNS